MHTLWATFAMDGGKLGLYKIDKPFCFSAIPYTPAQLEQAFHVEELPKPTRTVITVCGAMRGVGGIDTWGSDVERAFHVHSSEDILFRFRIF
jgi:beta-galactosidase